MKALFLFLVEPAGFYVKALVPALQAMTRLERLYLNCICIGDEGARELATGLQAMTRLKVLYLHHNNIGAEGYRALHDGGQHIWRSCIFSEREMEAREDKRMPEHSIWHRSRCNSR